MEGGDELGQGLVAGVDGDLAGGLVDDEAVVDVGLLGPQGEGLAALDFAEGCWTAGGDAAFVDGEVGVGYEGCFCAFDGGAAG